MAARFNWENQQLKAKTNPFSLALNVWKAQNHKPIITINKIERAYPVDINKLINSKLQKSKYQWERVKSGLSWASHD